LTTTTATTTAQTASATTLKATTALTTTTTRTTALTAAAATLKATTALTTTTTRTTALKATRQQRHFAGHKLALSFHLDKLTSLKAHLVSEQKVPKTKTSNHFIILKCASRSDDAHIKTSSVISILMFFSSEYCFLFNWTLASVLQGVNFILCFSLKFHFTLNINTSGSFNLKKLVKHSNFLKQNLYEHISNLGLNIFLVRMSVFGHGRLYKSVVPNIFELQAINVGVLFSADLLRSNLINKLLFQSNSTFFPTEQIKNVFGN